MKYLLFNFVVIFIIFYSVSALNDNEIVNSNGIKQLKDSKTTTTDLARTRRRPFGLFSPFGHAMGYGFGIHALAILYWLKVKAVIISFIVGTAIVWGAKYFWGHKNCTTKDIVHEGGSIIPFEHGPAWSSAYSNHHDHIPYALASDHEHDPYSGYSGYSDTPHGASFSSYSAADISPHGSSYGTYSDTVPSSAGSEHYITDHSATAEKRRHGKRKARQLDNVETEDQISDMMFYFLGVGSDACRKRFLCEWEFRASTHPMTRMAFRIIGRGVFRKYARDPKDESAAKSFQDCATVHSQCTVIEEHIQNDDDHSETVNNSTENHNNYTEESRTTKIVHSREDPIAKSIFKRPLKM